MKGSTDKKSTYIRATDDSAHQLSKLALSLFTANKDAFAALGMFTPSVKVAIAYCIVLAEPEFKRLGVRLSANNNIWLKVQQENKRLDREAKDATK